MSKKFKIIILVILTFTILFCLKIYFGDQSISMLGGDKEKIQKLKQSLDSSKAMFKSQIENLKSDRDYFSDLALYTTQAILSERNLGNVYRESILNREVVRVGRK